MPATARLVAALGIGLAFLLPAARADETPFRIVGPAAGADCRTVQEAIDAVPAHNAAPKLILLQPGAYFGHTVLDKPFVTLRGAGPDSLLTYNLGQAIPGADGQEITWRGASALLLTPAAHDAVIENLTLENTFGKGMQAQACSVEADRIVFRRCRILGWQDTLRLETGRQLFEQCYISGHVDFIYGGATAFFDRCEIHCRDQGYITAPATPAGQIGLVFTDCRVTFPWGNPATYLGRPWKESSQAVFIRCELGAGVKPEGWKQWRVEPPLIRFAEYQSRGPGAEKPARVTWATFSAEPAPAEFARAAVLGDWNPAPSVESAPSQP
ncbi:MAG TPA: pectinesterase family protein [Opitutaceae bacterium]|nr:pectinesterase family protein [Opitutaceae bacterium]